ncbi:hypothetical protein ACFE04_029185 [Oxalis oulophora]
MDSLRILIFVLLMFSRSVRGSKVPCLFIFGDSLSDSGNNNDLQTKAKVNYAPYGVDFPEGPTGRFSNGRTTVDMLGEYLQIKHYIPPFATANDSNIVGGVNYASGSAGILDESGENLGDHISLSKQLENHKSLISRLTSANVLGDEKLAAEHLEKCLYFVMIGSNDYLNNYFVPEHFDTSKRYAPDVYANFLIQQYSQQLQTLYTYGARILAVNGLSQIGCVPYARLKMAKESGLECVKEINRGAELFNNRLKLLLISLNQNLTDANFMYIDNGKELPGFARDLRTDKLCCEVDDVGQCVPDKPPCEDRDTYMFFDAFHPTETMNRIAAGNIILTISEGLIKPSKRMFANYTQIANKI